MTNKVSMNLWVAVLVVVVVAIVGVAAYYYYKPSSVPSTGVSITFWEAFSPSEYNAFASKILPAFEAQHPNIHVLITNVSLSTSNFETAAVAASAPNVYVDSNNDEGLLYSAGLLLNLNPYLGSSYFSQFATGPLNSVSVQNGTVVFGLPLNENSILMYYNKAYITNSSVLSNTGALLPYLTNLNNTKGIWGFAYGMGATYGYVEAAWLAGFGGGLFKYGTYGAPTLNSSAMVNALEFWYNQTFINHINPDLGSGSGVSFASGLEGQLFETGKAAIMFDGPCDLVPLVNALGTNLGAAPLPKVSSTGQYFAPILGSNAIAVTVPQASGASAAQINASITFAEFLASSQAQAWMYNGSGDLPSNNVVLSQLISSAQAGTLLPPFAAAENLTAAEFSGVEQGILAQEQGHTIPQPSTPQMNYYYSGVSGMHPELGLYYTNKTITAQDVASCVQAFVASNGTITLPACS